MKKKNKLLSAVLTIAVAITALTGCGSGSLYESASSSYKVIDDIPGIEFAIPSSVSQATAVTKISDDMEFDSNTTYSYKNGTDTYFIFNMNNIVIMVQDGTAFNFKSLDDSEKVKGLDNSPILNTWFTNPNKKFSYDEDVDGDLYKMIANVSAGVTITTEIFGDFTGKLATISNGTDECSLFIGAPGDMYEDLGDSAKEIMETVAKSLRYTSIVASEEPSYDVSVSGNNLSDDSTSDMSSSASLDLSADSSTSISNNSDSESSAASTVETSDTANAGSDSSAKTSSDEIIGSATTDNSTSNNSASLVASSSNEASTSSDNSSLATSESVDDNKGKKSEALALDNQHDNNYEVSGGIVSDIYSVLDVDDTGVFLSRDKYSTCVYLDIAITDHYNQEQAIKIIKNYCESGDAPYVYQDAPEGMHWEAVKYNINYEPGKVTSEFADTAYANIKFEGLDGNALIYNGISYTERTYDISANVVKNSDMTNGFICYYAVPNGCREYMLVCGEGVNWPSSASAYYKISSEK